MKGKEGEEGAGECICVQVEELRMDADVSEEVEEEQGG